jgi:hypothetical protein
MGKINLQKVVIGGLIAGVVLNVIDFVMFGMLLRAQMAAAMQALGRPPMTNAQVPWFVFLDFVSGISMVWLYAAMRPRYGAGPSTAAKAGVAGWFFAILLPALYMWPMALMPQNLTIVPTVVALVAWPLAAVIGAKFYLEGAGAGAGMGAGAGAGMGARM